jgi:hypothetical protein
MITFLVLLESSFYDILVVIVVVVVVAGGPVVAVDNSLMPNASGLLFFCSEALPEA